MGELQTVLDKETMSLNGFMNKYGSGTYGKDELNDLQYDGTIHGLMKFRVVQPRLNRAVLVTVDPKRGDD
jgi:hypothetical protein